MEIINNYLKTAKLEHNFLKYADFSIKVSSNIKHLQDDFIQLLTPHFSDSKLNNDLLFSYVILSNNELFSKLQAVFDENSSKMTMTYCSNDKGTLLLDVKEKSKVRYYKTQKTPTILVQDVLTNQYYFIVTEEYRSNPTWYKDGFNFFEHIFNRTLNLNGSILIHAAMVKKDDHSIIICGQKRSGKTTMFFELCKKYGYIPVSVDKIHLFLDNDEFKAYGFPSRLRVLAGTLSKYKPEFDDKIPTDFQNCNKDELWKGLSSSKVQISYDEFTTFINSKFETFGLVTDILFPMINKDSKPENSQELDFDRFFNKIISCSYTPHNCEEDWWSEIGLSNESELTWMENLVLKKLGNIAYKYELHGSDQLEDQLEKYFNKRKYSQQNQKKKEYENC